MGKRNRRIFSVKNELLKKSQESALSAIQIYNNPLVTFKSESFIVLMVIAWTYLMHAYYKAKGIDYRYYKQESKRKKYKRTGYGAHQHWDLKRCLDDKNCPLEQSIKNNLKFLIGIRHEIEHQMTDKIDDCISAKFQACCINYNTTVKELFDGDCGLDDKASLSLQLFSFGEEQINSLKNKPKLPRNLIDFISDFEGSVDKSDPRYSYRVIYVRDNTDHENQADIAVRFIDERSAEGKEINNVLVKRVKYNKRTQNKIVSLIKESGYNLFSSHEHQKFWKTKWKNAEERNKGANKYGELVLNNQWLWYDETWLPEVKKYCQENQDKFKT